MPVPAHVFVHVLQFRRRRIQGIASLAVTSLQPQLHAVLGGSPGARLRRSVATFGVLKRQVLLGDLAVDRRFSSWVGSVAPVC